MIIERVSGRTYAEYMKNEVFLPLGMRAVVDRDGLDIPDRVTGHDRDVNHDLYPVKKTYCSMFGA